MPSPIGHSLAGLAAGWLTNRPSPAWKPLLLQGAVLCAIGMAPDLDLLWGRHSRETHSIGAAVCVGLLAAWRRWPVGASTRLGIFVSVALAWTMHPVMDAFSIDNAEPIGVMLWWPVSSAFVHAAHPVFDPISRHWNSPDIWSHNFNAAVHELLKVGPVALLIWLLRRRRANSLTR